MLSVVTALEIFRSQNHKYQCVVLIKSISDLQVKKDDSFFDNPVKLYC